MRFEACFGSGWFVIFRNDAPATGRGAEHRSVKARQRNDCLVTAQVRSEARQCFRTPF
jgi:hypothetical protein